MRALFYCFSVYKRRNTASALRAPRSRTSVYAPVVACAAFLSCLLLNEGISLDFVYKRRIFCVELRAALVVYFFVHSLRSVLIRLELRVSERRD